MHKEIKSYVESEAFRDMVHTMVKKEFKEILNMITVPFVTVTAPVAVLAGYLLIGQFNGTMDANKVLAEEIKNLSVAVAELRIKVDK